MSILPLDVLLSTASHGTPVSDTVKRLAWVLVSYSQSWVCTVQSSVVFVSQEQERAMANTQVKGRALVLDPVCVVPIESLNTNELHIINTGQGVCATSPEAVLSKEARVRRKIYAEWCPLKGYPSSLWLIAMVIISWSCTLCFALYPNNSLRPIAFPFTSVVMFLLVS